MLLQRLISVRFFRFLLTGGLNTGLTFCIYLILLNFIPYMWSYSFSYMLGIIFSFFMSRYFVFNEHQGIKSALFYPLVYLAQYSLGIVIIWLWVTKLKLPEAIAPLIVVIISLPMTYVLTKLVFVRKKTKI